MKDEDKLLKAATQVRSLVDSGQLPNDAVEKIAREYDLKPGQIELVSYSLNTGRQLGQLRNNKDILNKFASFPVADPNEVIRRIYPSTEEKQKEANSKLISVDYFLPPTFIGKRQSESSKTYLRKEATLLVDKKPEPLSDGLDHNLLGMLDNRIITKRAYDAAKSAYRQAEEKMCVEFEKLTDYFRTPVEHRFTFTEVDQIARSSFGKLASDLMQSAFDFIKENKSKRFTSFKEKRATELTVIRREINLNSQPFSFIKGAIAAVMEVVKTKRAAENLSVEIVNINEGIRDRVKKSFEEGLSEKSGFLGSPALTGAVAGSLNQSLRGVPASQPTPVDDMVQKIDDPSHLNEMRKIRAHAMLNSLLTDPDDPISSYDPEQVVNAFNEISQLVPRSSMQPFIMRPVLRRYLESNVQPFEAKELADIEKSLVSSRENKGLLTNG